jgi:hypothetical protein
VRILIKVNGVTILADILHHYPYILITIGLHAEDAA